MSPDHEMDPPVSPCCIMDAVVGVVYADVVVVYLGRTPHDVLMFNIFVLTT